MLADMRGEINSNTVIVGDFNTPLTSMDRSSRQKINKETQALNNTLDQMDLIDIYKAFHLKDTEYTFFTSAHGAFSRIDYMLGHNTSLSMLKKTEIISSTFSDHDAMRLEVNYKEKNCKNINTCRLSNMLLNDQWTTEEFK